MTTYASPVELQFTQADIDRGGFRLLAQVAGAAPIEFQVDTGSSGMVMSKSHFPPNFAWDEFPCFGEYTIQYYPSTNSHTGYWYYLPMTLIGTNKAVEAWAMVLVCPDTAATVAMMGVSAKGEAAAYNAFLNAASNGLPFAPSYVLTQTSVILGQTHQENDGYIGATLTVADPPLTPVPAQTNSVPFTPPSTAAWNPPSVDVTFAAPASVEEFPATLAFELDTGINQFLVACPTADIPQGCLGPVNPNNQWPFTEDSQIGVSFPAGAETPALNYTVIVGTTPQPGTPNPVGPVLYMGPATTPGSFSRANVGICPLNAYNYIYDALNGFLGFQQPQPQPQQP